MAFCLIISRKSRWQLLTVLSTKAREWLGEPVRKGDTYLADLQHLSSPFEWNEPARIWDLRMIGCLPDLYQIWLWTVCQLLGLLSWLLSYLGQTGLHCGTCCSDPVPNFLELDYFFKVGSKRRPGWAEAVVTGSTPAPQRGRQKVKKDEVGGSERNTTCVLLICFSLFGFLSCFVLIIGC